MENDGERGREKEEFARRGLQNSSGTKSMLTDALVRMRTRAIFGGIARTIYPDFRRSTKMTILQIAVGVAHGRHPAGIRGTTEFRRDAAAARSH